MITKLCSNQVLINLFTGETVWQIGVDAFWGQEPVDSHEPNTFGTWSPKEFPY